MMKIEILEFGRIETNYTLLFYKGMLNFLIGDKEIPGLLWEE